MLDIAAVCSIIVIAFVLFVSERWRVDFVAMLTLVALTVVGQIRPGFLSIDEAVSGFSDKATLTIGAMFVLSSGLTKTGAIGWLSQQLATLARGTDVRLFVVLMTIVGVVSAFITTRQPSPSSFPSPSPWPRSAASAPPGFSCRSPSPRSSAAPAP